MISFYVGKQAKGQKINERKITLPDKGKVIKNYYKGRVIKSICWFWGSQMTCGTEQTAEKQKFMHMCKLALGYRWYFSSSGKGQTFQ